MGFEAVVRTTVAEQVKEKLVEQIRSGQLPPGARLPAERILCEQFDVARTSVREAIQGLRGLGLVQRRGNGTYVSERVPALSLDPPEDARKAYVRHLFEVRRVIEVPLAELVAERASSTDREAILEFAGAFHGDLPLGEFRLMDRRFHWLIAQPSRNEVLAEVYGKVLEALFQSEDFEAMLRAHANAWAVEGIIRRSCEEHLMIAKAIAEGDVRATALAVRTHLDSVEHEIIARLV